MALSFPYPVIGSTVRPPGQGCTSCVHKGYCLALYWFMRNVENWPDRNIGRACTSWSDNPADVVTTVNADDIAQQDYINEQHIATEPHQSGITGAIVGGDRLP